MNRTQPRPRWRASALALAGVAVLAGCSDVLEVENPNNLIEADLDNPAAAAPIVSGANATLARGIGAMLGVYSTATDEVTWVGSRDAWRELDQGFIASERNEFSDDAFRFFSEGRWMADEAVKRVATFDAAGTLTNRNLLAQAYLQAGVAYVTTADMYDRFVISDRRDAGTPIPPLEMVKLYDTAIDYLTKGLAVARATNSADLQQALLGMRARAHYSKALWQKLNPAGTVPAAPLINDAQANTDATAALAIMPADYRLTTTLANDVLAVAGEVSLAYNLNQRRELGLSPAYGKLGTGAGAALQDPIDKVPAPELDRTIKALQAAYVNQTITLVSAREMRLILAEAALARGDVAGFTTAINALRALDRLTPFSGQVPAQSLLQHERRTNLFLQGRRLADQYRFGVAAPEWTSGSTAVMTPGTFFPITCIEIRSHPEDFPDVSC